MGVPQGTERGEIGMLDYFTGAVAVFIPVFIACRAMVIIRGGYFWPKPVRFLASKVRDGLMFVAFVLVFRLGKED